MERVIRGGLRMDIPDELARHCRMNETRHRAVRHPMIENLTDDWRAISAVASLAGSALEVA